uniref:Methyltransferase type 11 domain-containing protein n=1 Tax=viral metagenome TaxID=1070528 RepID=A0A6C0JBT1_9ZZZZ
MYKPTQTEQQNVFDVYDIISNEFNNTRRSVWEGVKSFLDSLPTGHSGFEIGCGNGKNMLYRGDLIMEGIDTCENFVKICQDKGLNVNRGNILDDLQIIDKYDFVISIAVFHHISDYKNRFNALYNMINMLKSGGKGLLTVWSVEQDYDSKKEFVAGDNIVKWHKRKILENGSQGFDIYNRYYYVYDRSDFYEYLSLFNSYINIEKVFNEKGNWFCQFIKK